MINMKKDVVILTGAGQIGMAIARRIGFGKKIVIGDKSMKNAETIAKIMNDAGFDTAPLYCLRKSARSSKKGALV